MSIAFPVGTFGHAGKFFITDFQGLIKAPYWLGGRNTNFTPHGTDGENKEKHGNGEAKGLPPKPIYTSGTCTR